MLSDRLGDVGVEISYLADYPQWIRQLAQWNLDEWGRFDPSNTLEKMVAGLSERLNRDRLPIALVANDKTASGAGLPLGMVCLKLAAMRSRPQYGPWLGNLYVVPEYRNAGIGSALVNRALLEARKLGVLELYLWTEKAEHFYQRFGFKSVERVYYLEQDARVMAAHIGSDLNHL